MRDPTPAEKLAQPHRLGRESGADNTDAAAAGATDEPRSASEKRGENRVAELRIGGHDPPEFRPRHRDHVTSLDDASRREHSLPCEHVELAEEPPGTVLGDGLLTVVCAEDDLHRRGDEDVEVVCGITLSVQTVADHYRPPGAGRLEQRDVRGVEIRDCLVISHGTTDGSRARHFLLER